MFRPRDLAPDGKWYGGIDDIVLLILLAFLARRAAKSTPALLDLPGVISRAVRRTFGSPLTPADEALPRKAITRLRRPDAAGVASFWPRHYGRRAALIAVGLLYWIWPKSLIPDDRLVLTRSDKAIS